MPRWWMDGSGPLVLSWAASLTAAAWTAYKYGSAPADGLGVLILISVVASGVALDNCRDGTDRHRSLIGGLACGALAVAGVVSWVAFAGK